MPMMNVWEMCMLVFEFCMQVIMCVRLNAIPFHIVEMLVVLVMMVSVSMRKFLMGMLMRMTLGQMQPNANRHQTSSNPKGRAGGFTKHGNSDGSSYKWCR
jgi:hypothetical protein